MKLVSFEGGFGRIDGGDVVPMGTDLLTYLETGRVTESQPFPLVPAGLRAPLDLPGKIICVGLNYRDHAAETGTPVPDEPALFAKYANTIIGPHDAIVVPALTQQPDYEAELAVFIGAHLQAVSVENALEGVAGYTCANDVSARDLQASNQQWMRGKTVDTFLPMGPWLVTPEEIPNPQDLEIKTSINGDVLQRSSTREMIWNVAELVSFISLTITLSPGDVILTGTPHGVGVARDPQRFLQDGDEVVVHIEGIGSLSNSVIRPARIPDAGSLVSTQ